MESILGIGGNCRFLFKTGLRHFIAHVQIFHEGGHDWKLQIQYTRQQDEGLYECRVSSRVPLVFYTFLHVVGKYSPIIFYYL
jgi:hypothetical protein